MLMLIIISKFVKTRSNLKYLIGYSDKAIIALVLIMTKISGYVKIKTLKDKNNNLMSFRIDYEKLLEKYKVVWTKIGDQKNIKLNVYQSMMIDI